MKTFPGMKFCYEFAVSYLEIRVNNQIFRIKKRIAVLEMAFCARKVFRTFEKRALGDFLTFLVSFLGNSSSAAHIMI